MQVYESFWLQGKKLHCHFGTHGWDLLVIHYNKSKGITRVCNVIAVLESG